MSDEVNSLRDLDDNSFLDAEDPNSSEEASTSELSNTDEVKGTDSTSNDDSTEQPYEDSEDTKVDGEESTDGDEDDDLNLPEDFDYKSAYLNLHKPLKANGTVVRIHSDDELRTLVQQGLGYTSKSQRLSEAARIADTLSQHGITKEDLSLLIDLHKKDPIAIQKYLQDAKVDPLDVDFDTPASYQPKNYEVSENETKFKEIVANLQSTEDGNKFITEISQWDDDTKVKVWNDPNIVNILYEQKANGVYDTIVKEINRQRLVGTLGYNVPFLTAYQSVGESLLKQKTDQGSNAGNVVTKRVVEPKSPVVNAGKLGKAGSSNKRTTNPQIDFSRLSDEEIMKL